MRADRLSYLAICLLTLSLTATAAAAGEFPYPKVDYAADLVMEMRPSEEAPPVTFGMKVFYSGGKQRNEIEQGGHRSVVIMDLKTDTSLVLIEEQKTYMEVPPDDEQKTPDRMMREGALKMTRVGSETVNGVKAAKYQVESRDEEGETFRGHYWMTPDNVPVRMEGDTESAGDQSHVTVNYTNIRIGRQDPALFKIPPGYKKMTMPAMPAVPSDPGMAPPEGKITKEQADEMKKQLEEMMKQMQKK